MSHLVMDNKIACKTIYVQFVFSFFIWQKYRIYSLWLTTGSARES